MIKSHSLATNQSYRYVIRMRPDMMFISPFPHPGSLDLGDEQHPIVRFGSMDASCCGNEDWLGVGFFDIMMTYLSRFHELIAEEPSPGIEYRTGWIAEEFLEMVLGKLGGAKLVEEERMRYVRPKTPAWAFDLPGNFNGDFRANSAKRLLQLQSLDSSKDHGQMH